MEATVNEKVLTQEEFELERVRVDAQLHHLRMSGAALSATIDANFRELNGRIGKLDGKLDRVLALLEGRN